MAPRKTIEADALPAGIPQKPAEEMTLEEIQRATALLQFAAAQAAYAKAIQPAEEQPREGVLSEDERELRRIQYETAMLGLEAAKEANQKTKETKEQRIARRKAALRNMQAEAAMQKRIQAACRHHVGGKGLADMLRGGKDGTSIICSTYPIVGMKLYMCTRCWDEVLTPSPALEIEDPKAYARQMEKYLKFEELFAESYNAHEMGAPAFAFTHKGLPIHPDMIPLALEAEARA